MAGIMTQIFLYLTLITVIRGEITLPEGDQVAIESANTLLPEDSLVYKISAEIPRIRKAYPNVTKITHQAQWAPGELLAVKITDAQIERLRRSKLGIILIKRFDWGGAHLYFSYPYNPINLGKQLEREIGLQSTPNNYINLMKRISFNMYRNEYTFEYGWGDCAFGWPCLYSHYWVFKQHQDGYIRLDREGGDPEDPPTDEGAQAVSDIPVIIEPYPYAPNKKYNQQSKYRPHLYNPAGGSPVA